MAGARVVLVLMALGAATAREVAAQQFQVDLSRENRVRFTSDAPLEDFEGVTGRMDGFVVLEGEGLGGATRLEASEFYFEVDLASLDTGIGLRNRHMRENYLETKRFPFAVFKGRVAALNPAPDGGYGVVARGGLTIHGVERAREIECRVSAAGSGGGGGSSTLRVGCAFSVALSDHAIPIPKLMFMKINELMQVELDFHLVRSSLEGR